MNAAAAQTAAVMKIYNALKAGAKLAPCGSRMNEWRLQAAGTLALTPERQGSRH